MGLPDITSSTIAVIGQGYVGLPLAIEFAKKAALSQGRDQEKTVIGFDILQERIDELKNGFDRTNEISSSDLKKAHNLLFTSDINLLEEANIFIVTVPTPINKNNQPNLIPLKKAINTIALVINNRRESDYKKSLNYNYCPLIIIESTVYPGVTEEICVPIISKNTGLIYNKDFFFGYSPERINPGDKIHRLSSVVKITSGSNIETAEYVDQLYKSIVKAGTHKAKSIKVAEAAKVIENIQRDLNIALVNELSIIFTKMKIDTLEVLESAGTKWNFLPFRPGLVGGHCIGVDPYYLTFKAEELGYNPEVVLAGRRINDGMANWIAQQIIMHIANKGMVIKGLEILILGLTFKENCPDCRNTKIMDLSNSLKEYGARPIFVDPWVDSSEAKSKLQINLTKAVPKKRFKVIVAAVAHKDFKDFTNAEWNRICYEDGIIFDLKGIVPKGLNPIRF